MICYSKGDRSVWGADHSRFLNILHIRFLVKEDNTLF